MPDPGARRLAGEDGLHGALLCAEGERDRARGGSARQERRLRGSGVELGVHLPDGPPHQEGAGPRPGPEASFDKAPEIHLKDPALIDRLTFVGETPEIPEAGICARPALPADTVARLKRALLAIKGPEHAKLLKQIYDIDGFVEASDRDYDPVRDALKLMSLGPPK